MKDMTSAEYLKVTEGFGLENAKVLAALKLGYTDAAHQFLVEFFGGTVPKPKAPRGSKRAAKVNKEI
jgi:hypothetical protein